jgi:hypothetical protein
MNSRYTFGGHGGPSDMIPPDTGGVEMRAPEALPFNRVPERRTNVLASADDPTVRRRLPLYALGLGLAMIVPVYFVSPVLSAMIAFGYVPLFAIVAWLRATD